MKREKTKNYRLRSKVYKTVGYATIGASAIGGVSVYNFVIRPHDDVTQELQTAVDMFLNSVWVEQTGYQLNIIVAGPFLLGLIIWLIIMMKKNRQYFQDKMSLGMLVFTLILYLIYSLIGYIMSTLIGALVGVMASEFIFDPIAKRYEEEANFRQELKNEKRRERARREVAKEDDRLSGTV